MRQEGIGKRGDAAGRRRLSGALFGVLLVALFAVIAAAEGLGKPSVSAGDVALVQEVPSEYGQVSEAAFRRALVQQAAAQGLKKVPKEGNSKFGELRDSTMAELLNAIWIRGEAEELGIKPPSAKKLADELGKIKEQNFPTPAAYKEFLKTSKLSRDDVEEKVELQVLSGEVTKRIQEGAGVPSASEISDYYEAAKESQFTTKPSRDVRVITNKDKAKVEAAKAALEKDASAANWKKVAQKYSSDPTTKAKGGLQPGLTEELLASAGPFKAAIFGAAPKEVVGPVKFQDNYTVIEVVKLNPEKVQTLEDVKAQISSTLTQRMQESVFGEFVANWQSKWRSRTFCAAGFTVESCSNYSGDPRPSGANPACYEANPKTPATACPAPVTSISPAVPGSVTILQPQGERKPQGPMPPSSSEAAAAALPEGVEAVAGQ